MATTINVLLLAPLKAGSGNLTTAIRIRNYFNGNCQYQCWMKDVNSLQNRHEFVELVQEHNINVILAIHALHSGSILTGDKFENHETPSTKAKKPSISKRYRNNSYGDQLAKCKAKRTSVLSENVCWSRQFNLNTSIEKGTYYSNDVEHNEAMHRVTNLPKLVQTAAHRKRRRSFPTADYRDDISQIPTHRRKRSVSQSTVIEVECAGKWTADNMSSSMKTDVDCLCFSEHRDAVTNIPYAMVCAGTDINEFSKQPMSLLMMSRAIYKAKCVISFSKPLLKKVAMIWPNLGSNKLLEIPQAVTTFPSKLRLASLLQPFGIQTDAAIFTIVAGIRPVKDPVFLMKAFSDWHQCTNSTVYLVIIGPMMDKEYCSQFIKTVNESPGVVYLGGLNLSDTHAAIRDSFALVNSSVSEGMSTAILEAMNLGIPVIAKDNLGNRALIQHTVDGLLYTDAQDFVKTAQTLMKDRNLYQSITRNAKQKIHERHNCSRERHAYLSLVNKLVAKTFTTDSINTVISANKRSIVA